MSELAQISLGVIIGVGLLLWFVIQIALADRRPRDDAPEDKPKPKD